MRVILNRPRGAESGVALPVALVFLVLLTLLGLALVNGSVMQEMMLGNTKDSQLAFQAAETALRDAELDVAQNITSTTAFVPACTTGLCTPPSSWTNPKSASISTLIDWTNSANTRSYGAYTGAPALPNVASQPLYVIEKLSGLSVPAGESIGIGVKPPAGGTAYRITVYATGGRPETHVVLESIYVKR
ncbi:hypothetical protein LMG7141_02956 [Ralstonia condita]|uniref:Pilus assembly protein PilX n=1 Tax=Ralstonia condita TaxID=3058600 RepID=A0ABM9JIK8_9RALS|nr:pilus assembly protein [Ralstonia sp. LMG 7141]CAJ0794520.1 hypothetical protein LMG7141_02956 [Ralstonia sp. LMG 7141]